jgi:hypothetical protein
MALVLAATSVFLALFVIALFNSVLLILVPWLQVVVVAVAAVAVALMLLLLLLHLHLLLPLASLPLLQLQ